MKIHDDLIVCECCDTVFRRRALEPGELATCTQCRAVLQRHPSVHVDVDTWLALTVAAAVAFVAAMACPVVRVGIHGIARESTIWQSVSSLDQGPALIVGILAAAAVIAIPAMQIALLLWLLIFARFGYRAPGLPFGLSMLTLVRPWSMVELSMVGVLITMIKLSGRLSVVPLAGAWAMFGLVLTLSYVTGRDMHALWDLPSLKLPRRESYGRNHASR